MANEEAALAALGLPGWLAAMGAIMFLVMMIFVVAIYVYMALALIAIAKKTNTPNAWLAWIPIANFYLMTQIAKVPGWTTAFALLPIIPVIGAFAFMGVTIWWWWKIAEAVKKPGWLAILMIIPIAGLVIPGVLAWSK